ncbi:MAG: hypothetical protein C0497_00410 [Gemmatimonas sp.]|nr:hypothetical protein [Gemmatimonas sp.]
MTTRVSPELQFVLAAVRRDAAAAEARVRAAGAVSDWDAVVSLAERREAEWWVWRALPAAGVPEAARDQLGAAVRALARQSLAGVRELLALVRALEDAGVTVVAYKGPALAADVHGDVGARRFTDLDLLVSERDRARARAALRAIGYSSPGGYSEREERFFSAWEGVLHFSAEHALLPVELHWRVQAPRYGAPQDPASILESARRCDLGAGSVLVPAMETQAVLLALHGVKHAWTSMLWVTDFARAVDRDGFDWVRFEAETARWGVRRAVHDALLVAHDLLSLAVPDHWLARARADAAAARLAADAVRGLVSDADSPNAGRESTARYDLQWLGSTRARLRYLALAAALPTPQERAAVRLPDVLLPLAYLVRAWRLLRHVLARNA